MPDAQEGLARQCRAVLALVLELHLRGYQRLRALPGMAPSGMYWRCAIAPATLVTVAHGARLVDGEWDNPLVAHYGSGNGRQYFGWTDAQHSTPSGLARRFIDRFPDTVEAGRGSDWTYSGWYVDMLHLTYPNRFPYAYSDWGDPDDHLPTIALGEHEGDVRVPLPPPGEGR